MQRASVTTVRNAEGEATPSPPPPDGGGTSGNNKAKRQCLRLDVGHHKNVFVTTFFRIWMYRRRHVLQTLLQLLVPPLLLVLTMSYLGTHLEIDDKGWTKYRPVTEEGLNEYICGPHCTKDEKGVITYAMDHNNTLFAKAFKQELETRFARSNIELRAVNEKMDMVRQAVQSHLKGENHRYVAGIEIHNPDEAKPNSSGIVGNDFQLKFTVLMAQKMPNYFDHSSSFYNLKQNNPEFYNQLLGIEMTVFKAFRQLILDEHNSSEKIRAIDVQSLAYPPHRSFTDKSGKEPGLEQEIAMMLTNILVLSMVPAFFTVVEGPVSEKENGFKLYLMLMGYPRGAYWFSWILNQLIVQVSVSGLQVWLLFASIDPTTGPLAKQGDWSLWLVVLILYNCSALSFFCFLAAFFRRGKMATYLALLIWLLSFHILAGNMTTLGFVATFKLSTFVLSCFIPSVSVHWAVKILTSITSNTWATSLQLPLTHQTNFTLSDVMLMMVGNFFIYFFLTLYVDNLNPGPLEYSQPWNYFFEGIRCRYIDPNKYIPGLTRFSRSGVTAPPPGSQSRYDPNSEAAIEFKHISKKFFLIEGVFGIENVKFRAQSGKITVLLGHHDSGRTTLMRLVCGEYAPTAGTVVVFGYNVRKDTQKVQSLLSVCTQKNLLCEYLTVMEHMRLIAKLKGLNDAERRCKVILESVGLLSQSNDTLWRLVNWQRRVLCVAMALLGDAPILLLDEPTQGLDTDVKRQIWALMKELRERGKTILMATDNIEEAYEVADRIVIMSRGRVAGVGPPSRLESLFETGYHLSLEVIPSANKSEIFSFLKSHVPSAKSSEGNLKKVSKAIHVYDWDRPSRWDMTAEADFETIVSMPKESHAVTNQNINEVSQESPSESPTVAARMRVSTKNLYSGDQVMDVNVDLSYVLPFRERANFPNLFKALDTGEVTLDLGIKNFTLRLYDMEMAFSEVDDFVDVLRATPEDFDIEDFFDIRALRLPVEQGYAPLPSDSHRVQMTPEVVSCLQALYALVVKRANHLVGNYKHVCTQMLAPVLILLIAVLTTNAHFEHNLLSHLVTLNTTTVLPFSVAPYRIDDGPMSADAVTAFQNAIRKSPHNMITPKNIGGAPFESSYDQMTRYKLHDEIIVGADFTDMYTEARVTAMFSPGYHQSALLSLQLMANTILGLEFPSKNYEIAMSSQSMLHQQSRIFFPNSTLSDYLVSNSLEVTFTVSLAFGYFIFTSGFSDQPTAEEVSRLKRFQVNTLLWSPLYWVGYAVIDFSLNIILIMILTAVMYNEAYHGIFRDPQFLILFLITGFFGGISSILASYWWSHYLLKTTTSYYATLSINQVLGLFTFLLYTIFNFDYIGAYVGKLIAILLQIALQPFTIPWNFYTAILHAFKRGRCTVMSNLVKEEMCSSSADSYPDIEMIRGECCKNSTRVWSISFIWSKDSDLWINFVILIAQCFALVFYITVVERRKTRGSLFQMFTTPEKPSPLKDSSDLQSIEAEAGFVENVLTSEYEAPGMHGRLFIIHGLGTSTFRRYLLHGITFAVQPGKCTAIVGQETSGLTVLCEILSGLRAISEGSVTYGGCSLFAWTTRRKLLRQIGVCPSKDPIINKLTGLQLLQLFARLRGVTSKVIKTHIDYWVQSLDLEKVIKKRCDSYSTIVRKKLAVALAAIGNPPVVIFDDPTANLDPVSKSQVLRVLDSLVHADRVVIVMTHDLSSIQRICSKIIFLVNGQMQLCENPDKLYKAIANDFTLIVKLKGDETGRIDFKTYTDLRSRFEADLDDLTLEEEQSQSLTYRIRNAKYSWSSVFEILEKIATEYSDIIQDYYVRNTSLADVYSSYALRQRVYRKTISTWDEFRMTYC